MEPSEEFVEVSMPILADPTIAENYQPGNVLVQRPYGLQLSASGLPEFSSAIQLSTVDMLGVSTLHAVAKGALWFRPATASDPLRLELRFLPFDWVSFSLYANIQLPDRVTYGNLDPDWVEPYIRDFLLDGGMELSRATEIIAEFMTGSRPIVVPAGTALGNPAIDPALGGRRRLDLSMQDERGYYVNPAHWLTQWPNVDAMLEHHPLLSSVLAGAQHTMLYATSGQMRYVQQGNPGADGIFQSPATAAASIGAALAVATPGEMVVVLDAQSYAEQVSLPNGVLLTSTAVAGLAGRVDENLATLPRISNPAPDGASVVIANNLQPAHISGFRITSGVAEYGGGVQIESSDYVEVAQNDIYDNQAIGGGGIGATLSGHLSICANRVRDNRALDGGAPNQRGQGGGIYLDENCHTVKTFENAVYRNSASNFGGGIAVIGARKVAIWSCLVGGETEAHGNRVSGDRLRYRECVETLNPRGGGGGIGVVNSEISISSSIVRYNEAHSGAGIELFGTAVGKLFDCGIRENYARAPISIEHSPGGFSELAGGDGGGISIFHTVLDRKLAEAIGGRAAVQIVGGTITSNSAGRDGGGVAAVANAKLLLKQTVVQNNDAGRSGGGVYANMGTQLICRSCEILGNQANVGGSYGGGPSTLEYDGTAYGGGIATYNSNAHIEGCEIRQNIVANAPGGGVALLNRPWEPVDPHYLDALEAYGFERASFKLSGCTIDENHATLGHGAGGGLYVGVELLPIALSIADCTLGPNLFGQQWSFLAKNVVVLRLQTNQLLLNDDELPLSLMMVSHEGTYLP